MGDINSHAGVRVVLTIPSQMAMPCVYQVDDHVHGRRRVCGSLMVGVNMVTQSLGTVTSIGP